MHGRNVDEPRPGKDAAARLPPALVASRLLARGDLCGKAPSEWIESAGIAKGALDVDLAHALAPVMAQVGVIEWSRRLVGGLGDLGDQPLKWTLAVERREKGGDINRMRADRTQRPAGLAHHTVIPSDCNRHAEDGKVERRAAAQFPVGTGPPIFDRGQLDACDDFVGLLRRVVDAVILIEVGGRDAPGALAAPQRSEEHTS